MLALPFLMGQTLNGLFVILSLAISAGIPAASVIRFQVQKRAYQNAVQMREQRYCGVLEEERQELERMVRSQRSILESEYPDFDRLLELACSKGEKARLWWRRPENDDFLSLRIGKSKGHPSFSVALPSFSDPFDPIAALPQVLAQDYSEIRDLPFLLPLKRIGSVSIFSNNPKVVLAVIYRLLADVLVHHSPKDARIMVLCDQDDAEERWAWLKWAPHTRALLQGEPIRGLAFHPANVNECLKGLFIEYRQRRGQTDRLYSGRRIENSDIVVILDDRGKIRQLPEVVEMIHNRDVGIHLVFAGEHHLPYVQGRLEVSEEEHFRFTDTQEGGESYRGRVEFASLEDMYKLTHALAHLELMGEKSNVPLPEIVRLSQIIEASPFMQVGISNSWGLRRTDRELLQFPMGVYVGHEGLEPLMLNLLPAERGGMDAYHTIVLGAAGSGKSEFVKSIMLAAASQYAPSLLNFFCIDFKGGATFDGFTALPHMVGLVTPSQSGGVERGLEALRGEIEARRQKLAEANVINIWGYNRKFEQTPMPHLILVLDEFANGLENFPRLSELLQLLSHQGQWLGMYLVLTSQCVTAAMDGILSHMGWRITFKVARQEEMRIVDRHLPPTKRPGHGYLRAQNGDIFEFQAGYAGQPVLTQAAASAEDFEIFEIGADGERKSIYQHCAQKGDIPIRHVGPTEESQFLEEMQAISRASPYYERKPIYLAVPSAEA